MTDLGTFGGDQSIARGMNDRNVMVGTAGGPGDTVFYGFTYKVGGSGPVKLPGLGGDSTTANDINNDDEVVGASLLPGDQVGHAFEFANGVTFDLNKYLPTGATGPVEVATSINPWGQIGGWGTVGGAPHGFIFTPTMGAEQVRISDQGFAPAALTARGVGHVSDRQGLPRRTGRLRAERR